MGSNSKTRRAILQEALRQRMTHASTFYDPRKPLTDRGCLLAQNEVEDPGGALADPDSANKNTTKHEQQQYL